MELHRCQCNIWQCGNLKNLLEKLIVFSVLLNWCKKNVERWQKSYLILQIKQTKKEVLTFYFSAHLGRKIRETLVSRGHTPLPQKKWLWQGNKKEQESQIPRLSSTAVAHCIIQKKKTKFFTRDIFQTDNLVTCDFTQSINQALTLSLVVDSTHKSNFSLNLPTTSYSM